MSKGYRSCGAAAGLMLSAAVAAQDAGLSVSAGLRLWQMQWTTFSYAEGVDRSQLLIQVPARERTVMMPMLALQRENWVVSLSGFGSTRINLIPDGSAVRSEFDANLGWFFAPSAVLTLGYKRVSQSGDVFRYQPRGPVVGVTASAPLTGTLSLVGSVGLGWLKTKASSDFRDVQFEADYRLSEVRLNYAADTRGWLRSLTLSVGWRMQSLSSREALGPQDARDLSQGLSLGVMAGF